jgi:asparagine synthetase B (glutamine-hydrolysing)
MPNGYGDGMSIQNKSAIVLLSGGLDSMVVALQIYLPHLLN